MYLFLISNIYLFNIANTPILLYLSNNFEILSNDFIIYFPDCEKWRLYGFIQRVYSYLGSNGTLEYYLFHYVRTAEDHEINNLIKKKKRSFRIKKYSVNSSRILFIIKINDNFKLNKLNPRLTRLSEKEIMRENIEWKEILINDLKQNRKD